MVPIFSTVIIRIRTTIAFVSAGPARLYNIEFSWPVVRELVGMFNSYQTIVIQMRNQLTSQMQELTRVEA